MQKIMKRTTRRHIAVKSFAFGLGEVFACGQRMYVADRRRDHFRAGRPCPRCSAKEAARA